MLLCMGVIFQIEVLDKVKVLKGLFSIRSFRTLFFDFMDHPQRPYKANTSIIKINKCAVRMF